MKPNQSDHGLELYDCTNSGHSSFDPFRTHGSIFIPHVQKYSISSNIDVWRLEGKVMIRYYRDHTGHLFEFRIEYSIFDQGAFDKLRSSFENKVNSVLSPYNSAKTSATILCNNMNEGIRRINEYNANQKRQVEEQIAETNARIRELGQQIGELNSRIDEKNNELNVALRALETARQNLVNKSNDCSNCDKTVETLSQQKVRLVKVNNGELNSDAAHQILSLQEKARCEFLKHQDALEILVPFESDKTQCSLKETIENLNFDKTKECIDDIKA